MSSANAPWNSGAETSPFRQSEGMEGIAPPVPPVPGSIRMQDASTAVPQRPSLEQARLIDQAERQQEQMYEQEQIKQARNVVVRQRWLIGGAILLVIVLLIALSNCIGRRQHEVDAHCVTGDNVAVSDSFCRGPMVGSSFIMGGVMYHFLYGGNMVGGRIVGGSTTVPPHTRVKSKSGQSEKEKVKPGKIRRGGFGVGGRRRR